MCGGKGERVGLNNLRNSSGVRDTDLLGFTWGNKAGSQGCDLGFKAVIWAWRKEFGPQCWDLDLLVTITSAPKSVMKRDAVNMAIIQRRERGAVQNPTDLDTDTDVVVSNWVTLSMAIFFLIWKLKWHTFWVFWVFFVFVSFSTFFSLYFFKICASFICFLLTWSSDWPHNTQVSIVHQAFVRYRWASQECMSMDWTVEKMMPDSKATWLPM